MFDDINRELDSLYQGMQTCKKYDVMLTDLKSQLYELNKQQTKYSVELDIKLEDVQRLNGKNLSALFYTILGKKEDKENKERQEVLAAQLKLETVRREIEEINYRITTLQAEKQKVVLCETEYNQLYKTKYDLLKTNNMPGSQEIIQLEEKLSKSKHNIKELAEAILAGDLVLNRISDAESSLNSAQGWGTWDLLGGGLISDLAKHSHIDNAKDAASDIQVLLNNFRSELADITIDTNITIDISGFTKFADFFFDGIIADWVVQSKIKDSLASVLQVKEKVNEILIKLNQMNIAEENTLVNINENLKSLIKNS